MSKIKTREIAKGTVKSIDKSAVAAERMKDAFVRTKDKAERGLYSDENSPTEYAADNISHTADRAVDEGIHQFNKQGQKGFEETRRNIGKAKEKIKTYQEKKAAEPMKQVSDLPKEQMKRQAQASRRSAHSAQQGANKSIKTAKRSEKTIKQSARSTAKTVKATGKGTIKTAQKSVKTAEKTAKTTIKTTQQAAKAAQKTAQASAKAAKIAAQTAKVAAKAAATTAKVAAKATIAAVKAIIAATKALISAIIAGGWVAVLIIILLCLVGAVSSSYYGIFFSSETSDTGLNITDVICEINNDYDNKIEGIKTKSIYDEIEITGSKANWKDILSVYSVMVATDKDTPMDTATIDKTKKSILSNIFWDMNSIDSITETRIESEEVKTSDEYGNETISIKKVEYKVLTISITSKTADDMTTLYSFSDTQKSYIKELMSDKNDKLWTSLIYNVGRNDSNIDIGDIEFNNESANDAQKKLLSVAVNSEKYGISARSGYCQAWVADVYQAVTGSRGSAHCALCAAELWTVSQDFSKIQVGATVYGYSNNPYGHVGIYIGNGNVIHNLSGLVKIQSLESWINDFKGFAWGWGNGNNLTSDSQYNCIR